MDVRNTLIFGTMYLRNEYHVEVVNMWADLIRKKGVDWLLIDSASPIARLNKLDRYIKPHIISFAYNIGHLSMNGHDGWGRAFCKGIDKAIRECYDYVVHIESDLLFRGSILEELEDMVYQDEHAIAPRLTVIAGDTPRLETGLMFMEMEYLRTIDFIQQYDWTITQRIPRPEARIASILGNSWEWPFRGGRNDRGDFNNTPLNEIDYLTHADIQMMRGFKESCDSQSS